MLLQLCTILRYKFGGKNIACLSFMLESCNFQLFQSNCYFSIFLNVYGENGNLYLKTEPSGGSIFQLHKKNILTSSENMLYAQSINYSYSYYIHLG